MRIIGLMSGTSADGMDAALVDVEGQGRSLTRCVLLAFRTLSYPRELRARLLAVAGPDGTVEDAARLNGQLGEVAATACAAIVKDANLTLRDVHLIGSHGHTIRHIPPSGTGRAKFGATLQIGEAAVIAERTGVPVVANFRPRDMAAGGQGAPLVPLADFLLFRHPAKTRALQNIGGIANVTLLPAGCSDPANMLAFDTGPGNMVIDAAALRVSGGRYPYDKNGRMAKSGHVDETLLKKLMRHPYFGRRPPKSTGREMFGVRFTDPLLKRATTDKRRREVLATLTAFVAHSIHDAYERFIFPRATVDEVLVAGGGVHNLTLMRRLRELFAPVPVLSTRDVGVHPDAREAIAFALLARESWEGRSGNVPAATGAAGERRLGTITYP